MKSPVLLTLALTVAAAAKDPAVLRVPAWTDNPEAKPAAVEAALDGRKVRIARVLCPPEDLLLIVVFDVVGDIALVDPARQSLVGAIEKLPPSAHVALMRAQDGLRVLQDPSADRQASTEAIRSLPVSGRPNLLDTIEPAMRVADSILEKSPVRAAVLYITDSDIEDYREDYTNPVINSSDSRDLSRRFPEGLVREKISKIDRSLKRLQAPLYVAHLRYQRDRLNEAYQNGLLQLTNATGGTAEFARTVAEVPDLVRRMVERIASSWRIDIEVPENARSAVQLQLNGVPGLYYRTRFVVPGR